VSKIKTALLIIVIACVVSAVFLWIYYSPQALKQPRFEIVNFKEMDTPGGYYQIVFNVNNTGTADATGVHGTVNVTEHWQEDWAPISEDRIEPGEMSELIVVFVGSKPTMLDVSIIVECNEGVTQQFTDLPP
jgi:uncharacterized protein (TIGR02588 family)